MPRLARWSFKHRRTVAIGWLLLLVVAFFIQSNTGSNYSASNRLSGTQSATAQELLQKASPGAAGDTERIVIATKNGSGSVTEPAVRASVEPMLGRVAHLPNVASVSSPYDAGNSKQISANHKVAFATVDFTKEQHSISTTEATNFVNAARAPNSGSVQVDVLGDVAAATAPASSSSTIIGVGAALVVLLLVVGALLPALLPLVSTGVALAAAISLIGALSNVLSMASFTSQLSILIGLGVGIDYSLFILTRVRAEMRRGLPAAEAIGVAGGTAGRSVLFAGITVCIALLGMLTVGVSVLSGAAIAASIAVLLPLAASQTLVPALIGFLGRRVLTRRQRAALDAGKTDVPEYSTRWAHWAQLVQGHRLGFGLFALALMVVLTVPAFSLRLGAADFGTDPTSTTTTTHRAYDLLVRGFGPGFSGPLELVAPVTSTSQPATFARVAAAAAHTPGVAAVSAPTLLPAGPGHSGVAVAQVYPTGSPQDESTSNLITTMRNRVIPTALGGERMTVYVGGQTALSDDYAAQLESKLPLFVAMVVVLSFLLLMLVFRSLLIPATAAVMNLLSVGAAFGVIVAVFQWGWLKSLIGFPHTGPIPPLAPILMFAVLFGLSTDYEVFLISRIHEQWLRRRNNAEAVNHGQAVAGRTITALATIMVVVFAAFVFTTDRTIMLIGLGMAVAVLIDALVVRTVLVPAVMHTFGKANWYFPAWLERRLPHLEIEATSGGGARRQASTAEKELQPAG
ncbi:MAG TPA: MMPL family transporter [Solirubrobacteraceae bacterium]|jgi:RND superfamily putative drug exporter|nr:MMPL family transporter [Solirubrobacteraceae bacterium]